LAPTLLAYNTRRAKPDDPVFHGVVEALQGIHSLARENGATALVVLQPSKEEVYMPLLGDSLPDAVIPFRAALQKNGIRYLDLLDEFRRRAANGEVLFFEADGHPNARGYALIAELVISHLKQHAIEYGL
jgi:hypothetical protein